MSAQAIAAATRALRVFLKSSLSPGRSVTLLTAWAHPLLVVGLVAGALGVSERLRGRLGRLPGAVLLGLLAVVFAWNVRQVVVLGGHGALRITKGITLEDYAELRAVGGAPERARIVAALSDPVVQRWVDAFLPRTRREFLPPLSLAVRDSGPMSPADLARYVSTPGPIEKGVVVLRRVDEKGDAGAPVPALWQNRVFALSALPTVHGALVFGRGWYRVEESDASPFPFVRRFRWLRKRGELFVLNGQGRERRLRLKIVAGPGNGDVFRRLRLYHNGAQIDDIRILTYAQLYSRPLRLDEPLEQIELETVEDGRPLPRPRPLWGPWVAADPRRLTVGVAGVELVAADESRVRAAELDFTDPAQVVDGTFEGVHRDRWMGHAATVTLRVPQAARAIRLRGAAPGGAGLPYPLSIRLGADGVSLGVAWLQEAGEFDVLVPLRDRLQAGTQVALKLEVAATFSGLDPRPLSLRLESVGFTTAFPDGRADGVAAPAPRVPTPSLRR